MTRSIPRRMLRTVAVGILLLGNVTIGALGPSAQGSPASAGRIAFVSARDGDYDIYVREADGSLTGPLWDTDPGEGYAGTSEYDPEWSPDGTKLVFSSNRDGDFEIFLMNPDGTGVRKLTDNGVFDRDPTWSPDGQSIVFSTSQTSTYGEEDLTVIHRDATTDTWSSPETLVTRPLSDRTPEFSPDGSKIVFAGDATAADFVFNIFVVNSDGSGVTQLTSSPQDEVIPTWSPDGSQIAFTSTRSGRSNKRQAAYGIWIMNADGSNPHRVTPDNSYAFYPDWSPGGDKIAVQGHNSRNGFEVETLDLATGARTLVATSKAFDGMPDW